MGRGGREEEEGGETTLGRPPPTSSVQEGEEKKWQVRRVRGPLQARRKSGDSKGSNSVPHTVERWGGGKKKCLIALLPNEKEKKEEKAKLWDSNLFSSREIKRAGNGELFLYTARKKGESGPLSVIERKNGEKKKRSRLALVGFSYYRTRIVEEGGGNLSAVIFGNKGKRLETSFLLGCQKRELSKENLFFQICLHLEQFSGPPKKKGRRRGRTCAKGEEVVDS